MSTVVEERREKLQERKSRVRNIRQSSKPPESPEEAMMAGGTRVAENLSPQLGSDATTLTRGTFDMRRLSIITPELQAALAYFTWRGKKRKQGGGGVRFWKHVCDAYLNLAPSIGGVGRRQLIDMQRAAMGAPPPAMSPEEKPGWFGRNIANRKWRERWEEEHGT